jgi:hypothetical protein
MSVDEPRANAPPPASAKPYWFPAKRYGYGWGPPVTGHGWVVLALYVALVVAGLFLFPPHVELLPFLVYEFVVTLGLVAVCYAKGEPPSWRWGD